MPEIRARKRYPANNQACQLAKLEYTCGLLLVSSPDSFRSSQLYSSFAGPAAHDLSMPEGSGFLRETELDQPPKMLTKRHFS